MKPKKIFALTLALAAALNLTGCGGSGGGNEKKTDFPKKSVPPIVEMVQKEGTELKNQNVSIKALKLESAVKDLSNGAYMPPMRYLDGAFSSKIKNSWWTSPRWQRTSASSPALQAIVCSSASKYRARPARTGWKKIRTSERFTPIWVI